MQVVLADAGPLVALLNRRDRFHDWAVARFDEFTEPLLSCEAALTEALHLLGCFAGGGEALLGLWRRGSIVAEFCAEREKTSLRKLMLKYRDLPMSLADACLVRMTELHAEARVWTLDAHFAIYRRHGRKIIPRLAPD